MEPKPSVRRQSITLPLIEYLNDLLKDQDWEKVPEHKALLIQALDKEEELVHVETIAAVNGDVLMYQVWWIHAWRPAFEKQQKDKATSEAYRQWSYWSETKIKALAKEMRDLFGPYFPEEKIQFDANNIVWKGDIKKAKVWGIDISNPPVANPYGKTAHQKL